MEKAAVISDAGPLISIACSGGLHWLHGLFERVMLTPCVDGEILVSGKPGVPQLTEAINAGWLFVLREDPPPLSALAAFDLDPGETSAICAAHALECLLIVDEIKARRAAKSVDTLYIGTAGLLIQAKEAKLIQSCAGELEKLISNGFYISRSLVEAVLKNAGETIENSPGLKKRFT